MASTADIRNGAVIFHKNKRMKVIEFQHVKPGKGGAFVRTKLKDIQSGKIIDETFTDENGIFAFTVYGDENYVLIGEKENYFSY